MSKYLTKVQAENQFKEVVINENPAQWKQLDKHAQRLEWDMFTDHLCKQGEIRHWQYNNWVRPKFIK